MDLLHPWQEAIWVGILAIIVAAEEVMTPNRKWLGGGRGLSGETQEPTTGLVCLMQEYPTFLNRLSIYGEGGEI